MAVIGRGGVQEVDVPGGVVAEKEPGAGVVHLQAGNILRQLPGGDAAGDVGETGAVSVRHVEVLIAVIIKFDGEADFGAVGAHRHFPEMAAVGGEPAAYLGLGEDADHGLFVLDGRRIIGGPGLIETKKIEQDSQDE